MTRLEVILAVGAVVGRILTLLLWAGLMATGAEGVARGHVGAGVFLFVVGARLVAAWRWR